MFHNKSKWVTGCWKNTKRALQIKKSPLCTRSKNWFKVILDWFMETLKPVFKTSSWSKRAKWKIFYKNLERLMQNKTFLSKQWKKVAEARQATETTKHKLQKQYKQQSCKRYKSYKSYRNNTSYKGNISYKSSKCYKATKATQGT